MMVRYLLDINMVSEPARREPAAEVYGRIVEQQHLCARNTADFRNFNDLSMQNWFS